ncbi:RDD family protein [Pelovirga terrestris]|uniref:Zinc-ribbon domain-containing protein n=1 Tax=Pelovirga terrestris TaxID=2771352 RepID=A0A8J6QYT6_9BACT|nr:RDD family protein [Pelovirga terrestris]MBD1401523.1 zinc-ribbon domain-containing protein [Pelovirga terrestris]
MKLTCPHCEYSRSIDPEQIPPGTVRVKCPLCTKAFDLPQPQDQQEKNAPVSDSEPVGAAEQPQTPRQQTTDPSPVTPPQPPEEIQTETPPRPPMPGVYSNPMDAVPKATFWMRAVATLVDAAIVFGLQMILGGLLALAGTVTVVGNDGGAGETAFIVHFFSYLISFTYYIFFTGYCGQTPGKMVLRIKVVRQDGSPISYGRAAFREVPAKFLSGIIFGVGYLMVIFDDQKRALHDRMSDTYVIKL